MITVANDALLYFHLETHPMTCFDFMVIYAKFSYFNWDLPPAFCAALTIIKYVIKCGEYNEVNIYFLKKWWQSEFLNRNLMRI